MGRNYSFELWLPRARLYEALSLISQLDGTDELAPLIWPDGRRLPPSPKLRDNDALIAAISSLKGGTETWKKAVQILHETPVLLRI